MTQTGGTGNKPGALVIQPKFADQIANRLPSPLGASMSGLQRGYMIWAKKNFNGYTGGPLNDGRDMIRFLFNPSTVSSDYQAQIAGMAAAMQYQYSGDNGNYAPMPLQQTVSWQLYFDRSFELKYGGNSSAVNDPAVIGCQADVYQFMQFTGMTHQGDTLQSKVLSQAGNTGLGMQVMGSLRQGGLMTLVPCFVFFGNAGAQMGQNPDSSNYNAVGSQLSYYGFLTEWSVEYTHWTKQMVPIRCAITVYFTMLSNTDITDSIAVWRDAQKLGAAPSTSPVPYTPGGTPPPNYTGT